MLVKHMAKRAGQVVGYSIGLVVELRKKLLEEFTRAKIRIVFVFEQKLQVFGNLPQKLFILAHFDMEVAARGATEIVAMIRHLQESLTEAQWQRVHPRIRFYATHLQVLRDLGNRTISRAEIRNSKV